MKMNRPRFLTLSEAFRKVVSMHPEKRCMQIKKDSTYSYFTYQDLLDESLKIANWLINSGIKKGDRVALILENRLQWPVCYFGILFSGAIAVPIDIQASYEDLKYILKDAKCRMAIASGRVSYLKDLKEYDLLEKIIVVDGIESTERLQSYKEIISGTKNEERLPDIGVEDVASIIYTSGTTGPFKGVVLTHSNFYSNFLSLKGLSLINEKDNILSILPLHHSYAFMVTLIVPLLSSALITYIDVLGSEEIARALREDKITILVVVPQIIDIFYKKIKEKFRSMPFYLRICINFIKHIAWIIRRLTKLNLSKGIFSKVHLRFGPDLRFIVCGGAKLNVQAERFFFKLGFTILEGYGLTETSPVVSINPISRPKIGSVGKVLPGVEVDISNPADNGIGEIVIKGPNVMKGYYNRQAETEAVLKNGWFYSADLGYLDRRNYLYIRGRVKETIVLSSGKNIPPEEIETHYLKSLFIKEICVLADESATKLVAVIVPNLEYFKKAKEPNVFDIIKWNLEYLSQKLPPYKRIRGFTLTSRGLPRTRLGKIKRFEVANLYKEAAGKKIPKKEKVRIEESYLSAAQKKALKVIKKAKNLDNIFINDHLELDLGIDSLEKIEILLALEKALGVRIKEEEMAEVFTIRELLDYIEKITFTEKELALEEDAFDWAGVLRNLPSQSLVKSIDLKPGKGSKAFSLTGGKFLDFIFRILFQLRVYGKDNLPESRFIICPNHVSYLDAFVIFASLPLRLKLNTFFVGLSRYFVVPVVRDFVKYMRVIPVDFSSNLLETMKAASFVIRNDKVLCVFPEGVRSVDGKLTKFKKGVGILAKELDAVIVPAYIKGTHQAWHPGMPLPRPYPIKVKFGKPQMPAQLKEQGLALQKDLDDYQAISLGLKEQIKTLAKEVDQKK